MIIGNDSHEDTFGKMDWCKICGQYDWTKGHQCPPVFTVWEYGMDEDVDGKKVFATDAERAAEKYCTNDVYREAEWNQYYEVLVRTPTGVLHKYEMNGEMVPEFTASEVTHFSKEKRNDQTAG